MPVLIERPKMTRTMYMALKRHILQEGERKKKEQRMEADAEAERIRKQREEANLRIRRQQQLQQEQEDNLTIEQLQQVLVILTKSKGGLRLVSINEALLVVALSVLRCSVILSYAVGLCASG